MWRDRLRKVYDNDLEQFRMYCGVYNIHKRLGYKTPEGAWKRNPLIEGDVNPKVLKVVRGTKKPAVYFQPEYDEKAWDKRGFFSFMVYRRKKDAQADFPRLKILRFCDDDIEESTFVDVLDTFVLKGRLPK